MTLDKNQVTAALNNIMDDKVRELLSRGLRRGQIIFQQLSYNNRQLLGYYAGNTSTSDFFSALCRGIEIEIDQASSLLLQYKQNKKSSRKYIEIQNSLLCIHLYNEKSKGQFDMPEYMKEKIKMNEIFLLGKQNYVVIAFSCENGNLVSGFDLVVYNLEGSEVYREPLDVEIINKYIDAIA